MKKSFLKFSILFLCIGFLFAACAGEENKSQVPAGASGSQSASTNTENPLSPGNLPPPGSETDANLSEMSSKSSLFFQKKELWDSFSEELREKVWENYSHSAQLTGAGPGGRGYYNTLFGRVSPVKALPPLPVKSKKSDYPIHGQQLFFMSQTGNAVAFCPSFICLDSPTDGLNTVFDSVIVAGRIRMEEAALFGPEDPVIMISVFKQSGQSTETIAQDIPIYGKDIATTLVTAPVTGGGAESQPESQPAEAPQSVEIGVFNKTVPLMGPGLYTVIITAFQNIGDSVTAQPIYTTIYRQDNPIIEIIDLLPPASTGNQYKTAPTSPSAHDSRKDPVHSGDIVSMPSVTVRVKVTNALSINSVSKNVGIVFQNFDEMGNLRYISKGESNFSPLSTDPNNKDDTPVKVAHLPLYNNTNKFVIVAHNQQMDDFSKIMGLPPPPASTQEFTLTNILPNVQVKLISPQEGKVVEPAVSASETIKVSFCFTGLPSLPGRGISVSAEGCVLNWNGDLPKVTFNGYELNNVADALSFDAATGIYSFNAKPILGGNTISVYATNKNYLASADQANQNLESIGSYKASFQYGNVNKLFENGSVKEKDNFLSRGLSLEINNNIIQKDLKTILFKYLNKPEFKDTFISAFKKNSPGITSICSEGGEYTVDTGDTTIDILPDTLKLGSFEILNITTGNDGKLHLSLRLNGFDAEADMRGLNSNVKLEHNGKDYGFIPISITIDKLTLNADVQFTKDDKGYSKLDITTPASGKAVELVGGDGLSNSVHVNSNRNPLAAGLEMTDVNGGILQASFEKSLTKTIVCGVENGLNNTTTGLGKWREDILKLVSYNNLNPFRIPLEFELLNKLVGIDIAYDLLRGDIQFSGRGVTIRNVPLRISPSPKILNNLPDDIKSALVGSLSMPQQTPELSAALPATDEKMNLSMSLSEDAINQALFAASMAGMLDLDIDPNFYTNNNIGFIALAAPTLQGMLGVKIDLNQNGVDDDDDLPILTRIRTDKIVAPTVHFLTASEVAHLNNQLTKEYARNQSQSNPSGNGENAKKGSLVSNIKYFRFSIPNLELSFYRVLPVAGESGIGKYFCFNEAIDDPELASKPDLPDIYGVNPTRKACGQKISHTTDPDSSGSCPAGYTRVFIPTRNGEIVSAIATKPEVPVVKFKTSITFYGVVQGVFREVLNSDKYEVDLNSNTNKNLKIKEGFKPTNFIRIKILERGLHSLGPQAQFYAVENHTPFSSDILSEKLGKVLIASALGDECENLNEIRIPIPERIPSIDANASSGLVKALKDFGLDYLDLGSTESNHPLLGMAADAYPAQSSEAIQSDSLYIDLLAHLGVCFTGETCGL